MISSQISYCMYQMLFPIYRLKTHNEKLYTSSASNRAEQESINRQLCMISEIVKAMGEYQTYFKL